MSNKKEGKSSLYELHKNPLLWLAVLILILSVLFINQPEQKIIPAGAPVICGDEVCSGGIESCLSCAKDCGLCPASVYENLRSVSIDIAPSAAPNTFSSISMMVKEGISVKDVKASIKGIEKPSSVQTPALEGEIALRYISIEFSGVKASDVESMALKFTVNKEDIKDKDVDANSIVLKRYIGHWQDLPVNLDREDSEFYYYSSQSPGSSIFAVVARLNSAPLPAPKIITCGNNICEVGESTADCCIDCGCTRGSCTIDEGSYVCKREVKINSDLIGIILVNVLIIIGIILLFTHVKTRKSQVYSSFKRSVHDVAKYISMGDSIGAIKEYNKLKEMFQKHGDKMPDKQKEEIYKESMALYKKLMKLHKISKKTSFLFGKESI